MTTEPKPTKRGRRASDKAVWTPENERDYQHMRYLIEVYEGARRSNNEAPRLFAMVELNPDVVLC